MPSQHRGNSYSYYTTRHEHTIKFEQYSDNHNTDHHRRQTSPSSSRTSHSRSTSKSPSVSDKYFNTDNILATMFNFDDLTHSIPHYSSAQYNVHHFDDRHRHRSQHHHHHHHHRYYPEDHSSTQSPKHKDTKTSSKPSESHSAKTTKQQEVTGKKHKVAMDFEDDARSRRRSDRRTVEDCDLSIAMLDKELARLELKRKQSRQARTEPSYVREYRREGIYWG